MVFRNLGTNEKDAFFSLLDEYFASRPEIFNAATQGSSSAGNSNPFRKEITGAQAQAAAAAVSRAGSGAAKFVSAGIKNLKGPSPSNTGSGGGAPGPATVGQQHGNSETMNTQSGGSLADRIAALQATKKNDTGGSSTNASNTKKFGDVDTSSVRNAFSSMKTSFSNPTKTAQSPPSRFTPPATRAAAPPEPEPEPEPEEQGDWAEALYDYDSAEPGDLELKEGQRVLVIERSSGDWWTGEMNGKKGLFPASYVQLL